MVLGENGPKDSRRGGPLGWFRELGQLLGGDLTAMSVIRRQGLDVSPWRLSACSIVLAMFYGLCMGMFALFGTKEPRPIQLVASMVKVPLVFYLTLLVTLPSLYVFNALVGSRLSLSGVVRLLVASIAVNTAVLASLGPIVAFFSVCTTSYPFMLVFNVLIFAVAGFFGVRFLLQTMQRMTLVSTTPPPSAPGEWEGDSEAEAARTGNPARIQAVANNVRMVVRLWIVVFGLVGAQMGWVLRPFVGNPNAPFTWFRPRESNFFQAVMKALSQLFS